MAARIRRVEHSEEVRQRIRTSQLVNRLMDHAVGKVEMSTTQIRAAEILLKKTVPDLSSMELSGDVNIVGQAAEALREANEQASSGLQDRVPEIGPPVGGEPGDVRH